jgi:hypothetical protein
MRSRRGAAALPAAALLVSAMLASATPTSYVGTGNGGQTVGEINNFPGASVGAVRHGAVRAGTAAPTRFMIRCRVWFSLVSEECLALPRLMARMGDER